MLIGVKKERVRVIRRDRLQASKRIANQVNPAHQFSKMELA